MRRARPACRAARRRTPAADPGTRGAARRDGDRGKLLRHQLTQIVQGARREQRAVGAVDQPQRQGEAPVIVRFPRHVHQRVRQVVIELPGPAAIGRHQRVPGDVLQYVLVVARLRRLQAEPRQRRLLVGVDLGPPAHGRPLRLRVVRMADAGIHQHQGAEALGKAPGGLHRHVAAEAVCHHDHVGAEAGVVAHRLDLLGVGIAVVAVAVVGVSHAGQVHRGAAVGVEELRRDEIPPVGVRVHAVDEQDPRFVSGLRAPELVGDVALVHLDRALVVRRLHRGEEPLGNGRGLAAPVPARHYSRPNRFRWKSTLPNSVSMVVKRLK
jgi:hypothetical protein